ncbi:hypothetical protein GOBAR_AA20593 [Gossypium barbadense]|uniref:Ferredoxin-thioredoxin reductase catalytic chain, chloroplastic n=1 Tax=Gossypium barbadense TaxID=3634 RepID=A0A2P5X9Q4_GOSBA|nr:hypothetical protein GOBAR_AA20593 [Gossypium barbadense]
MTLQATSCNFGAISSLLRPPKISRHRFVIRAEVEPSEKSVEIMRKFSEQYARRSGTYFCMDKGVTSVVIKAYVKFHTIKIYPGILKMVLVNRVKLVLDSNRHKSNEGNQIGLVRAKKSGLAEHKDSLGAPLCPCRHYDDKAAEASQGFWNCPCVPMRERKAHAINCPSKTSCPGMKECHCMLFLTPDNDFAGQDQTITLEEIKETTANM